MRRRLAWSVACVVVLLAPPVHGSAVTSAVRPALVGVEQAPAMATAPTPAPEQAPVASAQAAAGASAEGTYGPVTATDTLWRIAERFRPDETVSVQRLMLALREANPQAFSVQNVNALKVGAVLRIPTREEIGPDAKAEALAEVRRQYAAWDANRGRRVGQVSPTPEGAASPTPAPVEPIGEVEPPAPEQPVVADAEIPEAEPPEAVAGAPAPAAAPSHAPWASFRDSLLEALPVRSVLIIGPLGLVLLIGGVVALVRRRHAAPEAEGVYGATAVPGGAAEETGVLIEGAAATEMPAAQTDDATETSAAAVSAAVEDEDTPAVQAAAMSEARAEREPEEDPLGRLTYYLAHRRYAHAEALVRGGIEQFPDRDEYRLKLLEVFDAAGDMSKYEEAARELEAAVGEDSPLMTMAARSRR